MLIPEPVKIVNLCRSNGSRGDRSRGKLLCGQDLHNLGRPSGRYTKYHQEDPPDLVTGSSIGPAEPGHSGLLIKKGRSGSDSGPSLSGEREALGGADQSCPGPIRRATKP